jgi:hypothetical protein
MLWAPHLKKSWKVKPDAGWTFLTVGRDLISQKKLTPYSMPKGSTWFNTSEIDGKSEYSRGCISRRKSRYGKTALTPAFVAAINSTSRAQLAVR